MDYNITKNMNELSLLHPDDILVEPNEFHHYPILKDSDIKNKPKNRNQLSLLYPDDILSASNDFYSYPKSVNSDIENTPKSMEKIIKINKNINLFEDISNNMEYYLKRSKVYRSLTIREKEYNKIINNDVQRYCLISANGTGMYTTWFLFRKDNNKFVFILKTYSCINNDFLYHWQYADLENNEKIDFV